jgi:hypothetical protein
MGAIGRALFGRVRAPRGSESSARIGLWAASLALGGTLTACDGGTAAAAVLEVLFVVVAAVLARSYVRKRKQLAGRAGGARPGLARGLILRASPVATETTYGGQRYELRDLVLDVEVPGQAPYEVSCTPRIPRICEALPGATLDLIVSRSNPSQIEIVGPLGSSAWLGAWSGQPAGTSTAGCLAVVAVIVASLVMLPVFGVLTSLVFDSGGAKTGAPARAPAPAAGHPACEAAVRCCETLGRSTCRSLASQTELACSKALLEERKAAAAAHKRCP